MQNQSLLDLQKALSGYHTYFKSNTILAVAEEETQIAFAYVIFDQKYKDNLLLSLAVDYPRCIKAVELTLCVSKIKEVLLAEPFYISSDDGQTYFNKDAYYRWNVEILEINKIKSPSDKLH